LDNPQHKHNAFMLLPEDLNAFLALAANERPAAAAHATLALKLCFANPACIDVPQQCRSVMLLQSRSTLIHLSTRLDVISQSMICLIALVIASGEAGAHMAMGIKH